MHKKLIALSCLIMAVGVVLGGCGSSGSYTSEAAMANDYYDSRDYMMEEAPSEEAYYDGEYEDNGIYEAKVDESSIDSDNTEGEEISGAVANRKLIKTVNLSVETRQFDELLVTIDKKITQLGGYAETSNVNGINYDDTYSKRSAYIVARIPADRLDSFVSTVEKNSNITSRNESAEDVTLQYSDVKAHIESLRVEQKRLDELLAQADSLETIIALEQRMTEVRYELSAYESRMRTMDNQVSYSTVYIDVTEVKEYKVEPVEDPSFVERLSEAFIDSCASAWLAIENFVIGFIAFLPLLLVGLVIFGIIGGIIYLIVKIIIKITKKSSAKSKNKNVKKAKAVENKIVEAKMVDEKPEKVDDAATKES